jgi:excisionase family DNA binding protein
MISVTKNPVDRSNVRGGHRLSQTRNNEVTRFRKNTKPLYCQAGAQVVSPEVRSLTFWLDSKEAAHFLKVSVPMLRNMTSNGQVPFYKLGRRNRYRSDELEALLLKDRRGSYEYKF